MNTIKDKTYKDYNYISRYAPFPYYYNEQDEKYMQGLTSQLSQGTTYILHKVELGETLDSIALDSYSNSTYFWVIADFNQIKDPFKELEVGTMLKIPTLAGISFEEI